MSPKRIQDANIFYFPVNLNILIDFKKKNKNLFPDFRMKWFLRGYNRQVLAQQVLKIMVLTRGFLLYFSEIQKLSRLVVQTDHSTSANVRPNLIFPGSSKRTIIELVGLKLGQTT